MKKDDLNKMINDYYFEKNYNDEYDEELKQLKNIYKDIKENSTIELVGPSREDVAVESVLVFILDLIFLILIRSMFISPDVFFIFPKIAVSIILLAFGIKLTHKYITDLYTKKEVEVVSDEVAYKFMKPYYERIVKDFTYYSTNAKKNRKLVNTLIEDIVNEELDYTHYDIRDYTAYNYYNTYQGITEDGADVTGFFLKANFEQSGSNIDTRPTRRVISIYNTNRQIYDGTLRLLSVDKKDRLKKFDKYGIETDMFKKFFFYDSKNKDKLDSLDDSLKYNLMKMLLVNPDFEFEFLIDNSKIIIITKLTEIEAVHKKYYFNEKYKGQPIDIVYSLHYDIYNVLCDGLEKSSRRKVKNDNSDNEVIQTFN